jgi:tetratricopeptide (TPR) repeat protein
MPGLPARSSRSTRTGSTSARRWSPAPAPLHPRPRAGWLNREAFALGEASGDPALVLSLVGCAYPLSWTGEYREAVAMLDRALGPADGDPTWAADMNFSPSALGHLFKGLFLFQLGRLDEAGELLDQGRGLARERGDNEALFYSYVGSAQLAAFLGEADVALGHARHALDRAERIGGSRARINALLTLGAVESTGGRWQPATEALERSLALSTERRTGTDLHAWCLVLLGGSYLGLGDGERARRLVDEGLAMASATGHAFAETQANLTLARVVLASSGSDGRGEIEAALSRALELIQATGARTLEPLVHVERAELLPQVGDEPGCERELQAAQRQFTEIGAEAHAARLRDELAISDR